MPRTAPRLSPAHRIRMTLTATACVTALAVPLVASQGATAASDLPVSDEYFPTAAIGFHDYTRNGSVREIRNDLTGGLGAMVEFAQASTVDPTGNTAKNQPTVVADRVALLLVTPTESVDALRATVRAGGKVLGTLDLAHPNLLPAADQSYDARGSVKYSLRAWSAEIPAEWMTPGMALEITDSRGRTGVLGKVEMTAPKELVINNIRLGMLTDPPTGSGHRFIENPAWGATDYFQTLPVAKLTMARYETVELDRVIVGSGAIYTVDQPDPSQGSVYNGTMRENVAKAQVSTGVNLATFGITSSPMNQKQPGATNQRVIHHAAGLYSNGRQSHGLSGGNGMGTLYDSVGNELSHELGHSYGLGHYPGTDNSKTGDDRVRNASHNMDSGWGYIAHRNLMRSNLDTGTYNPDRSFNGSPFGENLVGKYNFNVDAMSGGWDASDVSDYTHHTAYSLTRIQSNLVDLVADTAYPSGYRDWDADRGVWVDAKVKNPGFALPAPAAVGVPVFTLLGGYNPANAAQAVLYPAFRSNYGVTFDLPQGDPSSMAAGRSCWVKVDFADAPSQHITVGAGDGVKQLNINIAEADRPTGAQVQCRANGVTTDLGDRITIATDLAPMPAPVIVGEEAGFEALRAQELKALEPKLAAQSGAKAPTLSVNDMRILTGWSDDLTGLSATAKTVADRILQLTADAAAVDAYLAEHATPGVTASEQPELAAFLTERGYVDPEAGIVPTGTAVTVDNGRCLYRGPQSLLVDGNTASCATDRDDTWFVDVLGRIHSAQQPQSCVVAQTPAKLQPCSTTAAPQRWVLREDGHVVRASDTNSALDHYRVQGHPGMYGVNGGANQIWRGFTTNVNPLLGYLSARGLAALVGDVAAAPAPEVPPTAEGPEEPGGVAPAPGENPALPDEGAGQPGGPVGEQPDGVLPQPDAGDGTTAQPGTSQADDGTNADGASATATGVTTAGAADGLATTGTRILWGAIGSGGVLMLAGAAILLYRRARMA